MNEQTWDIVADIIEASTFFKRYGRQTGWTSGSSTYVYPITLWKPNKEVEIQLFGDLRGIQSSAKALVRELRKHINIIDFYLCKWDGSCPNVYRFIYE